MKFLQGSPCDKVGRLFIDVVHYNDDRCLLLPVDASDVSIYELTYLADDVVIP